MLITLIGAVGEQGGGVFRRSDSQGSLFQISNLLPDEKRERLAKEWPGQFRQDALPLVDEEQFRDLYCSDNGRPNKPVCTVVGVLVLKESKEVSSASLQSPHDVDATYSGHKGKGYEVQVAETVGNGEQPELITLLEDTPACQSDEAATVPTVEALAERKIQPQELIRDTNYAAAANVIACEQRGTEVLAPVRVPAEDTPKENQKTLADFSVDDKAAQPVLCPAGHAPESVEPQANGSISATFARLHCAQCPLRKTCPAKGNPNGTRTLKTTMKEHVWAKRRRYEQTEGCRLRGSVPDPQTSPPARTARWKEDNEDRAWRIPNEP